MNLKVPVKLLSTWSPSTCTSTKELLTPSTSTLYWVLKYESIYLYPSLVQTSRQTNIQTDRHIHSHRGENNTATDDIRIRKVDKHTDTLTYKTVSLSFFSRLFLPDLINVLHTQTGKNKTNKIREEQFWSCLHKWSLCICSCITISLLLFYL